MQHVHLTRPFRMLFFVVALLTMSGAPSMAQTATWTGGAGDEGWVNPNNWNISPPSPPPHPPTASDYVLIDNANVILGYYNSRESGATAAIDVGQTTATQTALTIDKSSHLSTTGNARIGIDAGSNSIVRVLDPSVWAIYGPHSLTVGVQGAGTLQIEDGGRVFMSPGGVFTVGEQNGIH